MAAKQQEVTVIYGEDRPTSVTSFRCYFYIETPTGGKISIDDSAGYMKRKWTNRDENAFGSRRVHSIYSVSDRQFYVLMSMISTSFGKGIKRCNLKIVPTPNGDELRIVGYGGFGLFEGRGKVLTPVEEIDSEVQVIITPGKGSTNATDQGLIF